MATTNEYLKSLMSVIPDIDKANPFEVQRGLDYELVKMGGEVTNETVKKALAKAVKNVLSDANYYTHLLEDATYEMLGMKKPNRKKEEATTEMEEVKKKDNMAPNQMVKAKIVKESLEEKRKNPADFVIMDVPLFIRMLEYAREDATSDMDLHDVAEKLIRLSAAGKPVKMSSYDSIVSKTTPAKSKSEPKKVEPKKAEPKTDEKLDEKKKLKMPDFPDVDGDDDTEEPIAKATKDKKKSLKESVEDFRSLDQLINYIKKIGYDNLEDFLKDGDKAELVKIILNNLNKRPQTQASRTTVGLDEDVDLGHEDDEPDMLKASVYRIAKYAADLYKMLDKYDQMEDEVDFPDWWQEKIHLAADYMDKTKHYLEFEEDQPSLDAMVPTNIEELDESFKSFVGKLKRKGLSGKAAMKIAGKIANLKRMGHGKGPTAKQKARMGENKIFGPGEFNIPMSADPDAKKLAKKLYGTDDKETVDTKVKYAKGEAEKDIKAKKPGAVVYEFEDEPKGVKYAAMMRLTYQLYDSSLNSLDHTKLDLNEMSKSSGEDKSIELTKENVDLIKKMVKEIMLKKGKETRVATNPSTINLFKQQGFQPIPGTEDAK